MQGVETPWQGIVATNIGSAAFPLRGPADSAAAPNYSWAAGTSSGMFFNSSITAVGISVGGSTKMLWVGGDVRFPSGASVGWSSASDPASGGIDVGWVREAADAVAQRRSTNPQVHRWYNTFTDGSNYERFFVSWAANVCDIGSQAAGTGTQRQVRIDGSIVSFRTAAADRWRIGNTATGALEAAANYRFSHGTSALATNATEGFFHINSCAGVPTGTPASITTGQIPAVYDSNANRWFSYNGAWRGEPCVLNVNVTAVGNVGTGTDDLITYTVPANILAVNGNTIRIKAWGTTANNANAKTVTFVVGSQTVLTTAMTASIAGNWEVEVYIVRTGSNTQDIMARLLQGATLIYDQELTAGTQTDSGTIVVKCTGNATSNNDIVQEGMIVELIN